MQADEYVKRRVLPIFNKVIEEGKKNPLSVGFVGSKNSKEKPKNEPYCIYHPHNYRLYLDFNKQKLNTKKLDKLPFPFIKTHLQRSVFINPPFTTHRLKNSTEHEIDNYYGCRLTIKKTQVEIQNKVDPEKKYIIKIKTDSKKQFQAIVKEKNTQCMKTLKKFIREFNGSSDFNILNIHTENKIFHEDIIDSLPIKLKWHGNISKKVYNEQNVEFTDPAFACNYIESRAMEIIAPELKEQLDTNAKITQDILKVQSTMSKNMLKQSENINFLAENLNTHIPVLNKLGNETGRIADEITRLQSIINFQSLNPLEPIKSKIHSIHDVLNLTSDINLLSDHEKGLLSLWITKNFGGGTY